MNVEKRIEIERKVVRHLIRAMKAKGWIISRINDGGEPDEDTLNPNETQALDTVFSVDESVINFKKDKFTRFVLIALGNDGWDCIADHSVSNPNHPEDDFSDVMKGIDAWIDASDDGSLL